MVNLSRTGTVRSSSGGSCCCIASRAVVDSNHLHAEELHKAVGHLPFAVMGWQRPGGCAGQEIAGDPVRVTFRCRGDGGLGIVSLCTVDEPHDLLLLTHIQLSADLKAGLEPLALTLSP